MDYGIIFRRSFAIAWRYKLLWIFGLFASGVSSFNLDFRSSKFDPEDFSNFDPAIFTPELILSLIGVVLILVLLYFIIHCISAPALVDAANRLERGGQFSFGASFSTGIDFFLRTAGLSILIFVMALAVIGVLLLIGVVIVAGLGIGLSQGEGDGSVGAVIGLIVLAIFIGLPILLFISWFLTTLQELAQRALVVRNLSISDSLAEAWYLLKNNFGKCIVIYLIYVGMGMGIGFVMGMIFLILKLVVEGALFSGSMSFVEIFLWGLIAGLPFSLFVGGFFGTAFFNFYTLFYFSLVDPASMRETSIVSPQPLV